MQVLDDNRQWWKTRNSRGQVAHVPHTIVTAYHPGEQVIFSNPLYAQGHEHYSQVTSSDDTSTSILHYFFYNNVYFLMWRSNKTQQILFVSLKYDTSENLLNAIFLNQLRPRSLYRSFFLSS